MIHEAKWLSRIGISIPEGAQEVQHEEAKSVKKCIMWLGKHQNNRIEHSG